MFTTLIVHHASVFAQVEEGEAALHWLISWWPWLAAVFAVLFVIWIGVRYIPNNSVGVVEKLWSSKGSVPGGQIIALNGEAGFQVDAPARRRTPRLLALAILGAQGPAGHDFARQDRLRLCPRRRALAAEPDSR